MAGKIDRRGFLKHSLLAGGATLAAMHSFEEKALGAEMNGGMNAVAPASAPARASRWRFRRA